MREDATRTLLLSGLALVAGFALTTTFAGKRDHSNASVPLTNSSQKNGPDEFREARNIRRSIQQALAPKTTWRTEAPVSTFRQEMIIAQPFAAFATWSAADAAEHELIQFEMAMLLGDGETFGIDCFPSDRAWPEFTYSLTMQASPTLVTVGGFKVTSDNLPRKTRACLEALFQGESTRKGDAYTPFERIVERRSDFVEKITARVSEVGRDELLHSIGSISLDDEP